MELEQGGREPRSKAQAVHNQLLIAAVKINVSLENHTASVSSKAKENRDDEVNWVQPQQPHCVLIANTLSALLLSAGLWTAPGRGVGFYLAKACSSLLEINCDLVSIVTKRLSQ